MWFFSGIGTYIRHLVSALEKRSEFDITLMVSRPLKTDLKQIEVKAAIYNLLGQREFAKKVPPCDIFWSPHFNVPLVSIPASKRVVTIHDVCHLAQKESFSWSRKALAKRYISYALQKSDLVLSVSSFSKEEIFRYFPGGAKKIEVVSSGIPSKPLEISSLTLQKPFILYVGNIKSHKNLERLLEAFKRFPENEIDLILAGKLGMKLPAFKSNVSVLENLSDAEIAFLYKKAKLLIQPSLYEGFGFTPLEAMSHGCPVVASSRSSLPEICADAAYYIDPLSVDSLHLGMKRVLEDPALRGSLKLKGYERMEHFSWDAAAAKITDLFLKVL